MRNFNFDREVMGNNNSHIPEDYSVVEDDTIWGFESASTYQVMGHLLLQAEKMVEMLFGENKDVLMDGDRKQLHS